MKRFGLLPDLESKIAQELQECFATQTKRRILSESIVRISTEFQQQQVVRTPWDIPLAAEAYLAYFLPLGFARAQAVVSEANELGFFEGFQQYVDFGSGPGTVSFALYENLKKGLCIETSPAAIRLHKKFKSSEAEIEWAKSISNSEIAKFTQATQNENKNFEKQNTLLTMSYSLNELKSLPEWIFQFDGLLVLEPSTQFDFQKLAELRRELVARGWYIWAPCTHADVCPLNTPRDWCHSRIEFESPAWWDSLDIPMQNKTITYSYLLARRDKSVSQQKMLSKTVPLDVNISLENQLNINEQIVRVVGDQLIERGKTRQLVCRGEQREFLSWLHKHSKPPQLDRGDLIRIPLEMDVHGTEIRMPLVKRN